MSHTDLNELARTATIQSQFSYAFDPEKHFDYIGCFTMSDDESVSRDDRCDTVLDIDRLIIEVERRSALYNKQLKEYSDRNIKEKLWGEVCINVIRNWMDLSALEKQQKGEYALFTFFYLFIINSTYAYVHIQFKFYRIATVLNLVEM